MAVEVVSDWERQERPHAHRHRSQNFIPDVEVIVCVAAALSADDAIVWVIGRNLRRAGAETGPDLQALQNEIDPETVLTFHALQIRGDVILFAYSFFGPLRRNPALHGECCEPAVVFIGSLAQDRFGDGAGLMQVPEEVHDVLWPGQQRSLSQDDETVAT